MSSEYFQINCPFVLNNADKFSLFFNKLKGRWKREIMGVRKEPNVREWSRTVAIEVYLQSEPAAFE